MNHYNINWQKRIEEIFFVWHGNTSELKKSIDELRSDIAEQTSEEMATHVITNMNSKIEYNTKKFSLAAFIASVNKEEAIKAVKMLSDMEDDWKLYAEMWADSLNNYRSHKMQ
ncbi:MAG: hypothetical protein LBT45_04020 [Rickettsiales bacterium]|jgi:hypothetical protein|nr:hypothetical protein [Rickettsiales bacterium]